jgi:alkylation response protein AidB-like acyl-CoA dehydrogenase
MAELGILGICVPVRYGGQGFDYITLGLVCEELERADTTLRVVMSVHMGLNSLAILQWGTEEQKQKFLTPQARGEKYAAFCLTEPGVGSDVANMVSTAKKSGDKYILNGEKMWISLASKAHHFLFFAKTDTGAGARGITAFIVTRDMPGVTTGDIHGKLGVRAGSTGWVKCIAQHQLIKQKIAFMQQWYDAAFLLNMRAGWMKNQGIRNTRETSVAKWYATDHSVQAALEAVQVHGAYGFSDEYPVERYLRNSKGAVIYEGTSEIHQLMQADYAFGFREDKPLRCELPAYDAEFWQSEPEMA